jgi:hypothetical protein
MSKDLVKPAADNQLKLLEHVAYSHHLTMSPYDTVEHLEDPAYWQHLAQRLRVGDFVTAVKCDYTLLAKGIVLDVGRTSAKVKIYETYDLAIDCQKLAEYYEKKSEDLYVEWQGPKVRYCVLRKDTKTRVQDGFADRTAAEGWIKQNLHKII